MNGNDMDFSEAFKHLLDGSKISRPSVLKWYLELQVTPYKMVVCKYGIKTTNWCPAQEDILATDWRIHE